MADIWQAAEARNRFSDVVDAAVDGRPQFVRRRDGREVVVVSKEYFEETKPNLKSYLATSGYADSQDDAFDVAIRGVSIHRHFRLPGLYDPFHGKWLIEPPDSPLDEPR